LLSIEAIVQQANQMTKSIAHQSVRNKIQTNK